MAYVSAGMGGRKWILLARLGLLALGCTSRVEPPASPSREPPAAVETAPPGTGPVTEVPVTEVPVKEPPRDDPPPPPGPVGQPRRVADIHREPVKADSQPSQFVKRGDTLLFTAQTPNEGRELWRWDAREGARLVKDFRPGPESSILSALVPLGEAVYFIAPYPVSDPLSLWRSDGTTAGTRPVTGLIPPGRLSTSHFADLPGRLLLTRTDDDGTELWTSNGTPEGSRPVWRSPGPRSLPLPLLESHGALFFVAQTGCAGIEDRPETCAYAPELWRVDASGQRLLWRAGTNSHVTQLTIWKDTLVFSVAGIAPEQVSLWKSDVHGRAPERWMELDPGASLARLTPTDGPLFFLARRDAGAFSPYGVWASDGTARGTAWLHDVQADSTGRYELELSELAVMGSTLYFESARTADAPPQLWRTDGTPTGTRQVRTAETAPDGLLVHDGWLYFSESLRSGGSAWMRTDGTVEGTEQVKVFSSRGPGEMRRVDGALYFAADDGQGVEPWTSRGTAASTRLLQDLVPAQSSAAPRRLTPVGDTLYFTANDGLRGEELWSTDGSEAGTHLVHEFIPGPAPTEFAKLEAFGARLALSVREPGWNSEWNSLWFVEGSSRAPRLVRDHIRGGGGCPYTLSRGVCAGDLAVVGDTLLVTDARATSGTQMLYGLYALRGEAPFQEIASWLTWNPSRVTVLGDALFFHARSHPEETSSNAAIWTSGGTRESTRELTNQPRSPEGLVRMGPTVFFKDREPEDPNTVLWALDVATGEVRRVPTGDAPVNIWGELTVAGAQVFFFSRPRSDEPFTRQELWVSDGTSAGTHRVRDFDAQSLRPLTAVGDDVFFWIKDAEHGWALWRSDGSARGTTRVKALTPLLGTVFALPGGRGAVFTAADDTSGMEVWWSDGTEAGTVLFTDIAEGPASSNPEHFTVLGDTLYFTADDQRTGRELWAAPLPSSPR